MVARHGSVMRLDGGSGGVRFPAYDLNENAMNFADVLGWSVPPVETSLQNMRINRTRQETDYL